MANLWRLLRRELRRRRWTVATFACEMARAGSARAPDADNWKKCFRENNRESLPKDEVGLALAVLEVPAPLAVASMDDEDLRAYVFYWTQAIPGAGDAVRARAVSVLKESGTCTEDAVRMWLEEAIGHTPEAGST